MWQEVLSDVRLETTLRIEGLVGATKSQVNVDMATGEIEVQITAIEVLG